jgi:hypothetical protein
MKESIFRLFLPILLPEDSGIEVFHNFVMSLLLYNIFNMSSFERPPSSHYLGPHTLRHFLTVEI